MMAVVYGTEEDKAAVVGAVRRQHSYVRGPGYDAVDAHLQRWTAMTLFAAICKVQEVLFEGWMGRTELEILCQEYKSFAVVLDMPSDLWPDSLDGFEQCWDDIMDNEIDVGDNGHTMARLLLYDVALPWYLLWMLPLMRVLVAAWLPEELRIAYGLPDPRGWAVWFAYYALVTTIRLVYFAIPIHVRLMMHEWMKRDMRYAAEGIRKTGRWTI
jgi:uncharacterized protein (DUF2236 family)